MIGLVISFILLIVVPLVVIFSLKYFLEFLSKRAEKELTEGKSLETTESQELEEVRKSTKKGTSLVIKGHGIYLLIGVGGTLFLHCLGWEKNQAYFFAVPLMLACFIWLIQFIYVIPMAIYFRKEKQTLKGILITSGITFLLGGGICGAMMLPNMFR